MTDIQGSTAIHTRGLARRFGSNEALRPLDLDIARGEIFGLLGHNGAGKTTAIRVLNGVLAPSAGRALVLGLDPATDGTAVRRRTGVSTETPSVDDRLTGRQGLRFFAELYGVPRERAEASVDASLRRFGLEDAGDRKVGTYSKGMRQRLALARALLHEPDLVFLDEPTSGLDPVATREVEEVIRRLGREESKTVVLCTHDLAQAQSLCDRVGVLEQGRLVALGRPEELAREYVGLRKVRVELDAEGVAAAQRLLEVDPRFGTVTHEDDDALSVGISDREAVPDLVTLLAGEGIRVYEVRIVQPSLEDVYFALHARRGAEDAS